MASAVHAFLFTDLEGSTQAWQADAGSMSDRLREHDRALAEVVQSHGGRVFKQTGDGICAVFPHTAAAIDAAVQGQRVLGSIGLRARMGVHAGPADESDGDFFGLTLSHCARVADAAHGGQIVVSSVAAELTSGLPQRGSHLVDLGTYDLKDFAGARLYQAVADGLRAEFPMLRATRRGPRLPAVRSRLIGRGEELDAVKALVATSRLVTLTGVGGCGKTRLALEIATELDGTYRDGSAFTDLAAIADPAVVPAAVGRALQMPPSQHVQNAADDLVRFLARKSALVVLDNCEHVLDACADLADVLLETCPQVTLIATTREPLGVAGEHVWRVRSLSADDAVALFVERARAIASTDEDDAAIREICSHLDGMPLAIELAAAQASHLPLSEISALLDDRFRLLGGGSRRSRQRHQTLEATMDWSYALLNDRQRRALRGLSVFPAAFDLDAAAAVWPHEGQSRASVAAALGELVSKSLVVVDPGTGRYRLLETVRLYGRQKLVDAGEAEATYDRHRDWILTWPEPGRGRHPGWITAFSSEWVKFDAIESDLEDVRAGLDWSLERGDLDVVARLIAASGSLWFVTTRGGEALGWLAAAPEDDATLALDDRIRWRTTAAFCHVSLMQPEAALKRAGEGLSLASEDHPLVPALLLAQAWIYAWIDPESAVRNCERIRQMKNELIWRANADYFEGIAAILAGDYQRAAETFGSHLLDGGIASHPGHGRAFLVVALHLLGEHDEAASVAGAMRKNQFGTAFLSDLTFDFADALAAIGTGCEAAARECVAAMLQTVDTRYPHLESAAGIALQGAAVLGSATGCHEDALALLGGTQALGYHVRYEGAFVAGRHYGRKSRAELGFEGAGRAIARGKTMDLRGLLDMARGIAGAA